METKAHYPTFYSIDFDNKYINIATELLKQPISLIFPQLIHFLNIKELKQLTCILHILLETPIKKKSIALIGWFTINNLVPPPTLYIFMTQLIANLNTKKGIKHAIIFAHAIYPRLNKFTKFCKSLLNVPNLEYYDLDLYNSLPTFIQYQIISSYETKYHWIDPKHQSEFKPTYFISNSHLKFTEDSKYQIRDNFLDSIEFSKKLPEEDRYSYHVRILLHFNPVKHYKNTDLLRSACNGTLFLLEQARSIQWEAYDYHSQFERLGNWISCLSIQDGPPPLFFLFPIQNLIRSSVNDGTILEILYLLIGFFTNISKKNIMQNPYTRSIIEMIAPIRKIKDLRTDVIEMLNKFEKMLDIDFSYFTHRIYNVIPNSPILFTPFIKTDNGSIIFQKPTANQIVINDPDLFYGYFFYFPDLNTNNMPPTFQKILSNIKLIEKFYFFGTPKNLKFINIDRDIQNIPFLQCIISLSLSRDRSISRLFQRLFYKILKRNRNQVCINFSSLFQQAFPSKEILEICFKAKIVTDTEINSLFSNLLTNPVTRSIALTKILKLMPLCLKYGTQSSFTSTKILLDCRIPTVQRYTLPMPDSSNLPLLHSFLTFSKNPNDRTDFISKMDKPSINSVRSLILFVLHATTKSHSPINCTTIDYSIIDCLCFALSKCSGKFNLENLTVKVIESIATTAINVCPKPFFRLIYGFLTFLHFQNTERMMQLFDGLNPGHFPTFSCCWIQIIMHKTVFPNFLRQSSQKVLTFCIKFLGICFQLVESCPEVFYKPVARILATTAASQPLFFVSYAPLILEKLPINFVQYRNLILSASLKQQDPDSCPPMGFSSEKIISAVNIADVINRIVAISHSDNFFNSEINSNNMKCDLTSFVSIEKVEFIINVLKNSIKNKENLNSKNEFKYVPKIITHFVIYCFSNFIDEVHQLLIKIALDFDQDDMKIFLIAVVDQLRYPSRHSFAAMNFILSFFEVASEIIKEQIIIELIRRLFCVSSPPLSVKNTFNLIDSKFGHEIKDILEKSGEYETYINAKRIIGQLLITRSPSAHTIVVHE